MSNEQDNKRPKDEPHAFSEEERRLVAGIYRRLGELTEALRLSSAKPAPAAEPTQATLDLEPGSIAREIAAKPRTWCNTVKVWEWLAGAFAGSFTLNDMIHREAEISAWTKGKIGIASYSRIISTLKRAGAIYRTGRNSYIPLMPTDEGREAVERVARKRKEVAA